MCEFRDYHQVDKIFEDIVGVCGKPVLFHLNDSKVGFNYKADRHENLGFGHIWSANRESLVRLRELCHDNNIDMLLETPSEYRQNDLSIMLSN